MLSDFQNKQIEVIDAIEQNIKNNHLTSSTIIPVKDFDNDSRICLTSVHFPHETLIAQIQKELIDPLREIEPDFYYYPEDSLHLTIKNVRVIADPPNFSDKEIENVKSLFSLIIPKHTKFNVYFYRLLLFPNNLAVIGTTDPELDEIILDLDRKLTSAGIPDDKVYVNRNYFFSNMTLARFADHPSKKFKQKVQELSAALTLKPYTVDSVTLLSANAVMKKRNVIETWKLSNE